MSLVSVETQTKLRKKAFGLAANLRKRGVDNIPPEAFGSTLDEYLYGYLLDACEQGMREVAR